MAAELITLPFRPVINTRGVLEPGALLDVFQAGTTTRISVFSDSDLSAALSNPVVANSSGVFPSVYWDNVQAVRVRVRESDGTVLGDADPYFSDGLSSTDLSFLQSGAGAQTRTVQAKLRDTVSVKDFGAVGDGVADDRPAFAAAHAAAPAGVPILVPAGTYLISSNLTTDRRHWHFDSATLTGGQLLRGLIRRIDAASGKVSHSVGDLNQFGSYYAFGRNAGGPIGLQIGGGDPADGEGGNVFFADVYGGWTTVMPTIYPSSAELAVQPAAIAGACTTQNGGNRITRVSGGEFIAGLIGRRIYIGQGIYLISAIDTSAQTIDVTNLNASAVSFPDSGTYTYTIAGVRGAGICNTSGTAVTRVSGDPFAPLSNTEYRMQIGGTVYTVSSVADFNNITLGASAGTQTGVAYELWTSVDDLASAVRVHRISGAGFEENITIGAYGSGRFNIHAAGGTTRQYPLYIGTGFDTGGRERRQIALEANGIVSLGGPDGFGSLVVDYRDGAASNSINIAGGTTPGITVRGADANIALAISSKGTGALSFLTNAYTDKQFEISHLANATSFLSVRGDAFNQPAITANGAAADIDIRLIPKGAGLVLLGPWVTNADAAVNGYVTIKDAAGDVRKLATIA
jgi:hypothetical protein